MLSTFTACSRIEEVKEKIWTEPPMKVPTWINELVTRIAENSGAGFMKPAIRVTRFPCPTTFGGRWFSNRNGVGVVLNDDRAITRAVVIHEVGGHWQRWVYGGDEPGEHDASFYALMEKIYPMYGVPLNIARKVEAKPPKSWLERERW